jgi:pimeloyl-ACP methyl ester carboxylesterase
MRLVTTKYSCELAPHKRSLQLVVVIHGLFPSALKLRALQTEVEKALPEADLLIPKFPLLSNDSPIQFAEDVVRAIDEAMETRAKKNGGYDKIIILGHSIGALIVRKAYLFAMGQTQDRTPKLDVEKRGWVDRVERLILLGGVNRGWSFRKKPADMHWWKYFWFCVAISATKFLGILRCIHAMQRGTPFIANLRIQWLNLIRDGIEPAPTIQLLGSIDDIVSQQDNIDVESGAQFKYLPLQKTGHGDIINFSGALGEMRKAFFLKALLTDVGELQGSTLTALKPDKTIEHFIFVVHGIRDKGFWTRLVAKQIEGAAPPRQVRTTTASYGYFPMLDFLLLSERQKNVRWFVDEYTEALAKYPKAKMSFVGHSNGTYLLASALKRYPACTFHRVVFAGSVVPRKFDWDSFIPGRVSAIRNYVAADDWVVGIFPRFFEYFERLKQPDLGSAGVNGFTSHSGHEYEAHFVKGGHGAAIDPSNFRAIASFILDGKEEEIPEKIKADEPSAIVSVLSNLAFLVWAFLAAVILWGLYAVVSWQDFPAPVWARVLLFIFLLVAVLKNV